MIETFDLYRKGHHALKIWGLWISKEAEFNVDFKNINLPSDKIT
jgi:hypothetical protein